MSTVVALNGGLVMLAVISGWSFAGHEGDLFPRSLSKNLVAAEMSVSAHAWNILAGNLVTAVKLLAGASTLGISTLIELLANAFLLGRVATAIR